MILTIRTERPEAEISLVDGSKTIIEYKWLAHRQLAETIHTKIKQLLEEKGSTLSDLKGVVVYRGPGSFTGLRIGVSVANALSDSLRIPIVSSTGNSWRVEGLAKLSADDNEVIVQPMYGASPHITKQKR